MLTKVVQYKVIKKGDHISELGQNPGISSSPSEHGVFEMNICPNESQPKIIWVTGNRNIMESREEQLSYLKDNQDVTSPPTYTLTSIAKACALLCEIKME